MVIDPEESAALPADLPYDKIKLVFTDLDGTLYPGPAHEQQPPESNIGLLQNMLQVERVEAHGVPVILATSNNLSSAQAKMVNPKDGKPLRQLANQPGIYCNGAYVQGCCGHQVYKQVIPAAFLAQLVTKWQEGGADRPFNDMAMCIVGLSKDRTLLLNSPGLCEGSPGMQAAQRWLQVSKVSEQEMEWVDGAAFADPELQVLSVLLLLPEGISEQEILGLQQWLHRADLIHFTDGGAAKCSGEHQELQVCCKHVHVPGMGPEIEISPMGVNKGAAIMQLLKDTKSTLGVDWDAAADGGASIAVFGDARNDVELFGRQTSVDGQVL